MAARPHSSRTTVYRWEQSSGDRNLFEDRSNHLADGEAFDLEFGAKDEPMLKNGGGHCFDVIGSYEIASANGRVSAAGEKQSLSGPWAGAHQDALVLPRGPDNVHNVGDEFLAQGDGLKLIAQKSEIRGSNDGLHGAGFQNRFW